MGLLGSCPLMNCQVKSGVTQGCPYIAVGMQSALASAMGLPSMSISALWMLVFLTPPEVRSNLMMPSWVNGKQMKDSFNLADIVEQMF